MNFAERMQKIKPSATLTVSAKAAELRAKCQNIISLSLGEPDFPVPEHIITATVAAANKKCAKYTEVAGLPELREAIVTYFNRIYGILANPESTFTSNGGKQVLYSLCQVLLNPGDEVLLPTPYWISYPDIIFLTGAVPVFIQTNYKQKFKVTVNDLEYKITSKTKLLILNSPSNPTGACYTQNEINDIATWAISKGLIIISDEIYDQLYYSGEKPVSLSHLWQKNQEKIIIVNGLSKIFSIPGWRVGYTLAHQDLIKQLTKLQSQISSNICSLAQYAAIAALTGPYDSIITMRETYKQRRDIAMDIISGWKNVNCPTPEGAFYIFIDVSKLYTEAIPNSTSLCTYLMDKTNVAVVPGIAFGNDNCIRLSYSIGENKLIKALHNLSTILGK